MGTNSGAFKRIVAGLGRHLVKLASGLPGQGMLDLSGSRDIEWSWVVAKMGNGPGKALDFGCGPSGLLSLTAAKRGFEVVALDQLPVSWPFMESNISFIQDDILSVQLQTASFDLVINCSAVEHVGLAGRYGTTNSIPDGDLEAMHALRKIMKPDAIMLLTIPVGQDAVFAPLHRVYGAERLPRLLQGYVIEDEEYWVKDTQNRWMKSRKEDVLIREPQRFLYGLGCLELHVSEGYSATLC
ncbi:MAG: DUF268 domain-containing protein [Deltaproteobacteria bacterium]|nr:DUF268 domain-containing protein [Deltaproteobacteria bacterium]